MSEKFLISFDLWIYATVACAIISFVMDRILDTTDKDPTPLMQKKGLDFLISLLKGIFLVFLGFLGLFCFMIFIGGVGMVGYDLIGWWIFLLFLPAAIFWQIIKDLLGDYIKKFKK